MEISLLWVDLSCPRSLMFLVTASKIRLDVANFGDFMITMLRHCGGFCKCLEIPDLIPINVWMDRLSPLVDRISG